MLDTHTLISYRIFIATASNEQRKSQVDLVNRRSELQLDGSDCELRKGAGSAIGRDYISEARSTITIYSRRCNICQYIHVRNT